MLTDLIHLTRTLRRSPASAAAAILTLSLTLGAAASVLAIVDAVLLTPPPFADPDSLVTLGETPIAEAAAPPRAVPYATFAAWRERAGLLAHLEAMDGTNLTLTGLGAAERISATDVSPGLLPLLGISPTRGRTFTNDDLGQPVAMVSHEFWNARLGSDPDVLDRDLVLGGQPHRIVGVLPEGFRFALDPADVWRPLPLTPAGALASGYRVRVIARLSSTVSPSSLAAALDDVSRTRAVPARVLATPVADAIAGDAPRTIALLAAAAALAMLIAFANLAGLLLVRALDRRRELAVRAALGASRAEIGRQLLLESTSLVIIGVGAGMLLAAWWTPLLSSLALQQVRGLAGRDVAVNWRVFIVLSIVALAGAIGCGLLPALGTARRGLVDVLRRGSMAMPRELVWRRALVVGEVAAAFVLLLSMTLLGRSLVAILAVDPGFRADNVLTMSLALPAARYPDDARVAGFYADLHDALAARLGHGSTAIVDELPLDGNRVRVPVSASRTGVAHEVVFRSISSGYFDVMRTPVVAGRTFDRRDAVTAPTRVVLSRAVAIRLFGNEASAGREIWLPGRSRAAEVIGVVGDVTERALDDRATAAVYLSAWQAPSPSNQIVVRSPRADADVLAIVRAEVARRDPDLPVSGPRPLSDIVAESPGVAVRRVLTAAFTAFALLAVMLGAIGLFGVTAHDVGRRRAELALRMAVGADPMRLLRETLRRGMLMIGGGLVVGGLLSLWVMRLLGGLGFTVGPPDGGFRPGAGLDVVSISLPAVLLVAAGLAAILPAARRAARTDPLTALRSE